MVRPATLITTLTKNAHSVGGDVNAKNASTNNQTRCSGPSNRPKDPAAAQGGARLDEIGQQPDEMQQQNNSNQRQHAEEPRGVAEVYRGAALCAENNMPLGLLPLAEMEEVGYDRATGFVWLRQKKTLTHTFKQIGRQVSYAAEVTALVEDRRMKRDADGKSTARSTADQHARDGKKLPQPWGSDGGRRRPAVRYMVARVTVAILGAAALIPCLLRKRKCPKSLFYCNG